MSEALISKYFNALSEEQHNQIAMLGELYAEWNEKINVISRKDMENFYERHVLHALSIAKFVQFVPGTKILDVGTGGGFPGIPLAVFFPECHWVLCDSIGKKIHLAESIAETIGLRNVDFVIGRVEQLRKEKFHFIVSRAVAPAEQLYRWTQSYLMDEQRNTKANGYLFLKGGDLKNELADLKKLNKKLLIEEIPLTTWFDEPFFDTKKLVYIC
jgi:16S rRNA (guanine527-N7)-methyltransferase